MAFLGAAWAPQIIWRLSGGPRRFGELKIDIPDISSKMLSARLKDFEAREVVVRKVAPTTPVSIEYELTELGRELTPLIEQMAQFGMKMQARDAEKKQRKKERPHLAAPV